jgi:hypothetical protein
MWTVLQCFWTVSLKLVHEGVYKMRKFWSVKHKVIFPWDFPNISFVFFNARKIPINVVSFNFELKKLSQYNYLSYL